MWFPNLWSIPLVVLQHWQPLDMLISIDVVPESVQHLFKTKQIQGQLIPAKCYLSYNFLWQQTTKITRFFLFFIQGLSQIHASEYLVSNWISDLAENCGSVACLSSSSCRIQIRMHGSLSTVFRASVRIEESLQIHFSKRRSCQLCEECVFLAQNSPSFA